MDYFKDLTGNDRICIALDGKSFTCRCLMVLVIPSLYSRTSLRSRGEPVLERSEGKNLGVGPRFCSQPHGGGIYEVFG